MKNKGFVLMETIVVIVVISVALLTIFSSYNKILRKTKAENKYDTSEYIYMTNYIKEYLTNNDCVKDGSGYYIKFDMSASNEQTLENFVTKCNFTADNPFNVKGIYIIKNVPQLTNGTLAKFNANMIDYIRKLDVGETDELIIVEFNRPVKNWNDNINDGIKQDSNTENLNETYIASLGW